MGLFDMFGTKEIVDDSPIHYEDENEPTRRFVRRAGVSLLVGALGFGALVQLQSNGGQSDLLNSLTGKTNLGSVTFDLDVQGEYDVDPGKHYSFVRSGRVVEPARETTLTLTASDSSLVLSDCDWSIESVSGQGGTYGFAPSRLVFKQLSEDNTHSCSSIFEFPTPGDYNIIVKATTKQGKVLHIKESVQCYYVRRELHNISEKDWSRFLDTYQVVLSTPTHEGKQLYGEYYRSATYLSSLHLNNAGKKAYDHIHEGLGIITQHIALTNEFERAMQSITPAFSVPYWDYTIDETRVAEDAVDGDGNYLGYSAILNSDLFDSKYFGNTGSENPTWHAIANGRFTYQMIDVNASAEINSPYGYLRAPWNLNPSPYVTRYHQLCGDRPGSMFPWPSCSAHYEAVYRLNSWYDLAWAAGLGPHGPVHVWLGGIGGGCVSWDYSKYPFSAITEDEFKTIKQAIFIMLKEAYREDLVEFPKSCSIEDLSPEEMIDVVAGNPRKDVTDCRWVCKLHDDDVETEMMYLIERIANVSIIELGPQVATDLVKKVFCSETFWPGDHLEAASAIEASFWPIHPTLDRLVQFRAIANPYKKGLGVWWDPSDPDDTTYCDVPGATCEGHHPGDLTHFETIVRDSDGKYVSGYKTNAEIREAIDPTGNYGAHYIYDHFEWTHCEEQGLAFTF